MNKRKAYYYRVQISWPTAKVMHFKSYGKKEIKNWTKDHQCGPDDVYIDDPAAKPVDGVNYTDLTTIT